MARSIDQARLDDSAAGGMDTSGETMSSSSLPHDSTVDPGIVIEKICCVCGANVSGKKRMKDRSGRYWCYDCGMADSEKKHAADEVTCPDCQRTLRRDELVAFDEQTEVCVECNDKRHKRIKREQARIAAAEEEGRRQEARQRMLLIGVSVVVVALVAYVIWLIVG